MRQRDLVQLGLSSVGIGVVFLSHSCGFLLQQDRGVGFGREAGENEDATEKDKEGPVDPSPTMSTNGNPSSDEGTKARTHTKTAWKTVKDRHCHGMDGKLTRW